MTSDRKSLDVIEPLYKVKTFYENPQLFKKVEQKFKGKKEIL